MTTATASALTILESPSARAVQKRSTADTLTANARKLSQRFVAVAAECSLRSDGDESLAELSRVCRERVGRAPFLDGTGTRRLENCQRTRRCRCHCQPHVAPGGLRTANGFI